MCIPQVPLLIPGESTLVTCLLVNAIKMGFRRKSDGLVAQGVFKFPKNVMDTHYTLPYPEHCGQHAGPRQNTFFEYPCTTRYADFIGFSPKPHHKPDHEILIG